MPRCSFRPPPPVQEVTVSVRPSSDNDPGEIVVGYFILQDGCVVLTDAAGTPLKDAKPEVLEGVNPKNIAASTGWPRRYERGASPRYGIPLPFPCRVAKGSASLKNRTDGVTRCT
jgi:hypothetical protein